MSKFIVAFTALALAITAAACGGKNTAPAADTTTPAAAAASPAAAASKDIVDTAIAAGSFETLVAAIQAAGLVETLKGSGPFTVFAPTDEAFAKLPPGTVEALLADKAALTAVLTYHVVSGAVSAEQVTTMSSATTVQGSGLQIDASSGVVMINDATVIQADIGTSNGVIHVIDTVLLPPQ